jgi:hypothetical protein
MQLTKTFEQKLQKWFDGFLATAESILKTGKGLVELIEENPDTPEILLNRYPKLGVGTLEALEQIGRGKLMPELMLDNSPGARRLAYLPITMQQKLYGEPIGVPVRAEDGTVFFKPKPIDRLTPTEVALTISKTGPLGDLEKKAALSERERELKRHSLRYDINGDKITFLGQPQFVIAELHAELGRILERNKLAAMKTLQADVKRNQVRAAA